MRSSEYGVDRLVYDPAVYDALHVRGTDIPFYLELARKVEGPTLELCCGTGRITLPLAEAGIDVTGVDIAAAMLNRARKKARERGLQVRLVKGDMRKIRLGRKFGLIFIPFNSLQNTYTLDGVEKVFRTVRDHLLPGGVFVLDVFNPNVRYLIEGERLRKNLYRVRSEDGRRVAIDVQCKYDAAGQVNRVVFFHRIDGGKPVPQRVDMRCFYPQELDALLKYNGFKVIRKFGDFDRSPFVSDSPKQIRVCRQA